MSDIILPAAMFVEQEESYDFPKEEVSEFLLWVEKTKSQILASICVKNIMLQNYLAWMMVLQQTA